MIKKIGTICILLMMSISMALYFGYKGAIINPLNKTKEDTIILEAKGGTFYSVMIDNEDKFKNLFFLRIYNKLNKISISVMDGKYEVPSDISLPSLLEALENGTYNKSIKKITIPEGYTVEQIADVLDSNNIIEYDEFIKACNDYELPEYIKFSSKVRYDLEGYLFPDTYFIKEGSSGKDIISIMLKRFEEILAQIESECGIDIDYENLNDIIIKASMIEKEVRKKEEKFLVSSVIDNRIEEKMPLQIDATVLYALGEHKSKVTIADTKVQSLYNTYYIKGMPIGPISNPGKDSIIAAFKPEKTKYLYYMTKDGLNHEFFEDYVSFLKYKNS